MRRCKRGKVWYCVEESDEGEGMPLNAQAAASATFDSLGPGLLFISILLTPSSWDLAVGEAIERAHWEVQKVRRSCVVQKCRRGATRHRY